MIKIIYSIQQHKKEEHKKRQQFKKLVSIVILRFFKYFGSVFICRRILRELSDVLGRIHVTVHDCTTVVFATDNLWK